MKYLILMLLLMISACSKKISPTTQEHYYNTIKDSLKPVVLPADSSMIRALFECDSAGKVILRDYNELKSKGFDTKIEYRDGELRYRTIIRHDTVYVPFRDKAIIKEYDPVVVERKIKEPLAWWQEALMWIGAVSTALFVILLIWMIRRIWVRTAPRCR